MKAYIMIYLSIALIVSLSTTYAPGVGAGEGQFKELGYSDSGLYAEQVSQEEARGMKGSSILDAGQILRTFNAFKDTIITMTTFNFTLGGAPAPLNLLIRGIMGIMSLAFIYAIIKEVINAVGT